MSTAPTTAKICIACGQDCSAKPRTKDTQGRYTCKACLDAIQAKQAAAKPFPVARPAAPAQPGAKPVAGAPAAKPAAAKPAAPKAAAPMAAPAVAEPDDDAGFMAQLLQDSPALEPCPSCGHPLATGSVLCTACGFNTQTGTAMATKKIKAAKEKRQGPGRLGSFLGTGMSGLAAAGVLGLLFVLGITQPDAMPIFILVGALYYLVFFIVMLVDAFKQSVVTGLLCFIPIYPIYYLFSKCENPIVKIHMPIAIAVAVAIRMLSEFAK